MLAGGLLGLGCQAIAGFDDFEGDDANGGGGASAGSSGHAGSSGSTAGGAGGGGDHTATGGEAGQVAGSGGQSGGSGGGETGGSSGQTAACTGGSWGEHPDLAMIQIEGADGHCFGMDVTEVSREDYAAFLDDAGTDPEQVPPCDWNATLVPDPDCDWSGAAGAGGAGGADLTADPALLPVTCVDWCDAAAYCRWAGKRLCDGSYVDSDNARRSEWYSACSDGGDNVFPYGDIPSDSLCNGADNPVYDSRSEATLRSVDSQTECVTPDGVRNLSGNAAEWVDECTDTTGGSDRCDVRGGSFRDTGMDLGCASTVAPRRDSTFPHIGFRCCDDAS